MSVRRKPTLIDSPQLPVGLSRVESRRVGSPTIGFSHADSTGHQCVLVIIIIIIIIYLFRQHKCDITALNMNKVSNKDICA